MITLAAVALVLGLTFKNLLAMKPKRVRVKSKN